MQSEAQVDELAETNNRTACQMIKTKASNMWFYDVSCHSRERRNGNQPCFQAAEGKAAKETDETDAEEVWNSCRSTSVAPLT